ncbi:MAG: SPOR domain-containing protein, partial [Candidatus Edwardsbacteria bacterium]|nr:SPOR domain-containing protein [Candidatus Edwardsbacteria bacterium]
MAKSKLGWLPFLSLALLIVPKPLSAASEEQEYNQAWQQFQLGNTTEAIKSFTKYVARHPQGKFLPEAHFTLARIEPSGNSAFLHYQFIVDNFPAHELASQSAYATAQYYQNLGAVPEAKARFTATYSRYPATAAGSESLHRLALLAVAAESLEAGDRYAQAFLDNYPRHARCPALLSAIAEYWQAKGDTAQANPRWRGIMTRCPQSDEAGNAREQLLANADEEETASDSSAAAKPRTASESPVRAGPDRAAAVPGQTKTRPQPKGYYVQIGAYTNAGMMREWADKLASQGYACFVDSAPGRQKRVYRLQVGPYADRKQAQDAVKKLKA